MTNYSLTLFNSWIVFTVSSIWFVFYVNSSIRNIYLLWKTVDPFTTYFPRCISNQWSALEHRLIKLWAQEKTKNKTSISSSCLKTQTLSLLINKQMLRNRGKTIKEKKVVFFLLFFVFSRGCWLINAIFLKTSCYD